MQRGLEPRFHDYVRRIKKCLADMEGSINMPVVHLWYPYVDGTVRRCIQGPADPMIGQRAGNCKGCQKNRSDRTESPREGSCHLDSRRRTILVQPEIPIHARDGGVKLQWRETSDMV